MKITCLFAAAAIATASTAAFADSANVTTQSGDVVMVEKNQALPALGLGAGGFASLLPILVVGTIAAVGASGGS